MRKASEGCGCFFCQVDIDEPFYNRLFSDYPMLKTHSNQEHDNAKIHPPNPERLGKSC